MKQQDTIFETIKNNIKDGVLPDDFSLAQFRKGKEHYVDGSLDGMEIYHKPVRETTDKAIDEVGQIVFAINDRKFELAESLIRSFSEKYGPIYLRYVFLDIVFFDELLEIDIAFCNEFAWILLENTKNIDCVKFALNILTIFPNDSEELKTTVSTLALSDEFTIYALEMMLYWKKENDRIFDIAQRVKGWGRIHAVERLKGKNKKIRDWLLYEGVNNNISAEYSALLCFIESDAAKRLEKKPTKKEFTAIGKLITLLLHEERVKGISVLDNAVKILADYVHQAQSMKLKIEDYLVIQGIYLYAKYGINNKKLRQASKRLLYSEDCIEKTKEALKEGKAVYLAEELNIPYKETLFKAIEKDFDKNYTAIKYLIDDPQYTDAVLNLYRKEFPPRNIKRGTKQELEEESSENLKLNTLLLNLYGTPLAGMDYLEKTLTAASKKARILSLQVLMVWVEVTNKPLRKLSPSLFKALRDAYNIETVEEVKERMNPLLKGSTYFSSIEHLIE